MSTLFNTLDAAAQRVHDTVFGDLWRFTPQAQSANVNGRLQPDPTRPMRELVAIFTTEDREQNRPTAWDERTDNRPGATQRLFKLEVGAPARLDVKKGDLATRIASGETFLVHQAEPDDTGRLHLLLNKV